MSNKTSYLNVFTVEEFDGADGKAARNWLKVGVAFRHASGNGFNIELRAFPRDGKLVVLPPQSEERETSNDPSATHSETPWKTGAAKDHER